MFFSETDVHGERRRSSWWEADWGAHSKVHWLDPQTHSFKVKQWMLVPTSLFWGEHSVNCEATKLARWKIEFVAEAMSSKRWRRFLRWLTALAQVYISICYIFCIFFAFAFWFTRPRMIDHIYMVEMLQQGYCCTFTRMVGEISKNEGGRPKQNLRNQKGN